MTERSQSKINRKSFSEEVKEYLIDAILNREFKPGDRIKEMDIAEQLGVSQSPVREALQNLVSIGFLESEPYKGTFVSEFSIDKLKEVYRVRAQLENLAVREAMNKIKPEDVESLEDIIEKMISAADQNNYQKQVKYDIEFHRKIIDISGNSMLKKAWNSVGVEYWTYVGLHEGKVRLKDQAKKHKRILDILIECDSDIEKLDNILSRHFSQP